MGVENPILESVSRSRSACGRVARVSHEPRRPARLQPALAFAVLSLALLGACAADAVPPRDAGTAMDAAAPRDAAPGAEADAGATADAGALADASPRDADSGVDAASPAADAGADAGSLLSGGHEVLFVGNSYWNRDILRVRRPPRQWPQCVFLTWATARICPG